MLFECSCDATKNVIDEAIERSIALRPRENTPLAELVRSTTVVPIVDLTAKLGEELKAIPMDVMQEQSDNGLHNGWTDEISQKFGETLARRIDIIKTTVIPVVKSITEQVLQDVESSNIDQGTLNVVRYNVCDMINIPSFMEDVKRNTPHQYFSPNAYFQEQPRSLDKVLELLKTGSTAADGALAIAINRIGSDLLFKLWDSLFVDRAMTTIDEYGTFDQFVLNPNTGLDCAIIIFQLANTLKSSPDAAREYKEAAAYQISFYANAYNRDIDNGRLIKSIGPGFVEVYAVNYTSFLQKGGTAEMVIGAAINSKYYQDVDNILENSKEVLQDYQVLKSAKSLEYRTKVGRIARDSFYQNFHRSLLHEQSEFEKDYFSKNQGMVDSISRKFDTAVDMISSSNINDLYRRVTEILCNTRFMYLDCYCFMTTIDELCQEGLDAEEALTQATLKEVCTSVVSMITK